MKILIASKNKNKIKEFKDLFNDVSNNIEFVSLYDLNDSDEVEENGKSFKENSFIKAKYFYDKYHMNVLADDSGLCVDALNGAPGIYSARYSGLGDKENNKKLLRQLINVKQREASFICDICYIEEGIEKHFEGVCKGKIALKEEGDNHFGYDPIFLININGEYKSFASISEIEKNKISHRGKAFSKAAKYLSDRLAN